MTATADATSELVLVADSGPVRTLTLNRPDQLNALNGELCDQLTESLMSADRDQGVHVLVLTGQGRAFSAGTDLFELAAHGDFRRAPGSVRGFEGLIDVVSTLSKPLVCAVNGLAVGVGATLLGLADLVLMAATARVRCPFTELSLVPEAAASLTFPLLLGRQAASWILLSSDWIEAEEARRLGLAWRVIAPDDLQAEAAKCAERLARHSLESLSESKRLIAGGYTQAVASARRRENAAFDRLLQSREHRLALDAFLSRRTAVQP